jgi:hypothetical protein
MHIQLLTRYYLLEILTVATKRLDIDQFLEAQGQA